MSLKIYNSLSNKVEEFITIDESKVNMYVCGPTVYGYIHIGNARPVIFFDVVKKYLEFCGYEVIYASNITDVDDKIINKAIEENTTEKEIALKYTKAFLENVKSLGSDIPTIMPKATDYIGQMIEFISLLIEKEYAYAVDGDVFFRVNKLKDYGKLSNQVSQELNSGVRIDVNSKKENPQDFNLWKKTDKGIKWDSPFGMGRPGWHTECVVMNNDIFKKQIDIHGGGMDLKFPHHENEIAQCNALYSHDLSKYWMHVGRLDFSGAKMSKSLGNIISVNELSEVELEAFRLLIVSSPYRSNINYSVDLLNSYIKELDKLKRTYKQGMLHLDLASYESSDMDNFIISLFKEHMDNDFNTQNVMTEVSKIVKNINKFTRSNDLIELSKNLNTFKTIFDVLGVKFNYNKLDNSSKELYNSWVEAKSNKDFALADTLREELQAMGVL